MNRHEANKVFHASVYPHVRCTFSKLPFKFRAVMIKKLAIIIRSQPLQDLHTIHSGLLNGEIREARSIFFDP